MGPSLKKNYSPQESLQSSVMDSLSKILGVIKIKADREQPSYEVIFSKQSQLWTHCSTVNGEHTEIATSIRKATWPQPAVPKWHHNWECYRQ